MSGGGIRCIPGGGKPGGGLLKSGIGKLGAPGPAGPAGPPGPEAGGGPDQGAETIKRENVENFATNLILNPHNAYK